MTFTRLNKATQLILFPSEITGVHQRSQTTILKRNFVRGEQEFPFPSIPKNESLWFSFPNYGNAFFHSLPVPEFRECFFSFPFLSRIMGMGFFHSLPIPKLWGWIFFIPFPFPNCGNGFFSFPSRSRIVGMFFLIPFPFPNLLFYRRESKQELDYCNRYQTSNFFSFLYISQNNYRVRGGKLSQDV